MIKRCNFINIYFAAEGITKSAFRALQGGAQRSDQCGLSMVVAGKEKVLPRKGLSCMIHNIWKKGAQR